jgi:DNA-binding transcriptional LysR family regulator
MNFQQLRSVREAARRNFNLTDVANALFTSQPGVSRQIRELEDELGVVIFERNGKRLTGLTDPGKGILKIVERLLVEAENLQQASSEYAAQDSGTLTVAVTHTQARYALPQVVQAFRTAFPGVRIALQQSAPDHIAEWVLSGRADIGIATEGLSTFPDLVSFPCYRWSHLVVVPDGHPLLSRIPPDYLRHRLYGPRPHRRRLRERRRQPRHRADGDGFGRHQAVRVAWDGGGHRGFDGLRSRARPRPARDRILAPVRAQRDPAGGASRGLPARVCLRLHRAVCAGVHQGGYREGPASGGGGIG